MSTTTERLDRLEAENADLRARLAAVEAPKPAPQPAPTYRLPLNLPTAMPEGYREPSVTIVLPRTSPMPAEAEMRELYRIVGLSHPALAPPLAALRYEADRHATLRRFTNAFRAASRLGRSDKLDHTRALSWWTGYAQSLCEPGMGQDDFDDRDFWVAALALGVPYRAWGPSSSVEFGLTWAGAGGAFGNSWCKILADGHINPPAGGMHQHPDSQVGRYDGPTWLR